MPAPIRTANAGKRRAILRKVVSLIDAGMRTWIAVKRKDPISIGLSLTSLYEAGENILEPHSNDASERLAKLGLVKSHSKLAKMIYKTINDIGVEGELVFFGGEQHTGLRVYKYTNKAGAIYISLMNDYVNDVWSEKVETVPAFFDQVLTDHIGDLRHLAIYNEGYQSYTYITSIEVPSEVYLPQFDEEEFYRTIMKFRDRGIYRASLLVGPPGIGKSTFGGKLAKRMGESLLVLDPRAVNIISAIGVEISQVVKLTGAGVLLFDDIDRVVAPESLLTQIQQLRYKYNGVILATANDINKIPVALRRTGRFDEIVEFGNPALPMRIDLLSKYTESLGTRLSNHHIIELAELTPGFSITDLREVALQASILDFEKLCKRVKQMKKFAVGIDDDDDDEDFDNEDMIEPT